MAETPKAVRGDQSRRDLMDAAIDCFARYGYQATSIDRIAKAGGVTKGALYYHFRDKEEMLFQAVRTRVGQFERRVAAEVAQCADAPARLRRVTDACVEHATKSNHRRFIVTLMVETLDTNARIARQFREMMERFRAFLASIIGDGQRAGVFRADADADAAAYVYAAAVMGAEIQYYQDPQRVDLAASLGAFVHHYIDWLSAAAANGASVASRRAPVRRRNHGQFPTR